jgi:predicted Zn-dependent protease
MRRKPRYQRRIAAQRLAGGLRPTIVMMSHRTLPALFAAATWTTAALAGSPGTSAQPSPSTTVTTEIIAGHYVAAVFAADNGLAREPGNPWLHYNRATALGHLLRTDEAIAAFDRADALFNSEANVWGRSISMYGKARAFDEANRCADASRAYENYAAFARTFDAASAEQAQKLASACVAPASAPLATTPQPKPAIGGGPKSKPTHRHAKHK